MTIKNDLNFKFVSKEVTSFSNKEDNSILEKRYIIGIKMGNIVIPHPITDFIDKKFYLKSGSINSEKAATDTLVQFLNYIIEQKMMHSTFSNVQGIIDLRLEHLEQYLEYCGEIGNKRKTVERKEYYLLQFYYFIGIEKNKLKVQPNIKILNSSLNYRSTKKSYNKKLYANLYYKKPSKDEIDIRIKKKDLLTQGFANSEDRKNIRLKIIRELLLLASKNSPEISFAVCLQIFGGLRAAECMNLTINSIKPQNKSIYGEKGLLVEIRDRQSILFQSSNSINNEQVKKPRDQSILIEPLVPYLYKKHLDWLKIKRNTLLKKSLFPNEVALFINSKGEPMKTHTYRAKFNSLKNYYLNILMNTDGRYEDFKEFQNTKWSTHICRGAFTNLCLDSGFNATQTAILRGDSSPEAMYAYQDILNATGQIMHAINLISESANEFPILNDSELIKTWNEVLGFGKK